MFSTLSPGALGLDLDHARAVELAAAHGFGGVDPDLGHLRSLGASGATEHGAAVEEKGLQWGMAGLPIGLDAPAEEFRRALVDLPADLELLAAAGVTRLGTWIRPMHDELDHRQNWRLHQGRIAWSPPCSRKPASGWAWSTSARRPSGPPSASPSSTPCARPAS